MPQGPNQQRPKPEIAHRQRAMRRAGETARRIPGMRRWPITSRSRRTGGGHVPENASNDVPIKSGETRVTRRARGYLRGIELRPKTVQGKPKNEQAAKKVVKGKKSLTDRVLRKVGIKRKKQR